MHLHVIEEFFELDRQIKFKALLQIISFVFIFSVSLDTR